jgi:hypothetical protein
MTDQVQQPIITRSYTESPASWNTKYINAHGFECQLTLRSDSGADLLKKADAAIQYLVNSGCAPLVVKPYQNGNGHAPEPKATEPPKLADGTVDPTWCPIHSIAMKRHEKDGRVWYSHKVGEEYCRGKK